MRTRAGLALLEVLLLTADVGCKRTTRPAPPKLPAATVHESALGRLLAPRAAGRFVCQGGVCRQQHPRLPDTGEWRCADRGHVVWCAGGEPAAGVVKGPADPSYRCGARWGNGSSERVCIDRHPDYPEHRSEALLCSFDQERGSARVCRLGEPWRGPALSVGALPGCWLDRDCPSGACDRGACTCQSDAMCQVGHCQGGLCTEVAR